jgi:tRNA-splicing ligase RtcB
MQIIEENNTRPIKAWIDGVELEDAARAQLINVAAMPFVYPHLAVMPDVHWGRGATVGSVIPNKGAIIPAAVGVDIGCGMAAVQTTLRATDLPDALAPLRAEIERKVPVGNGGRGDHKNTPDGVTNLLRNSGLAERLEKILDKHPKIRADKLAGQLGTLGGGNHFIEICIDENDTVWVMLHSTRPSWRTTMRSA